MYNTGPAPTNVPSAAPAVPIAHREEFSGVAATQANLIAARLTLHGFTREEALTVQAAIQTLQGPAIVHLSLKPGSTLLYDGKSAYLNLKEKRGSSKLGAGVDKVVYRALKIDREAESVELVAHQKFSHPSARLADEVATENGLAARAASEYVAAPSLVTLNYSSKGGESRMAGYAKLYEGTLQGHYSKMTLSERVRVLRDVAHGIQDLHRAGIRHQDLKWDNVLVERRDGVWRAVVADLGRSGLVGGSAEVRGHTSRMAPENCSTGLHSEKGDVWALGLLMREIYAGSPPFMAKMLAVLPAGSSSGERIDAFYAEMGKLTQQEVDEGLAFSPQLDEIVAGCLRIDSEARWSIDEVVTALDALESATSSGEVSPTLPTDVGYTED